MAPIQSYHGFLVLPLLVAAASAQIPSVWEPQDVVAYFCQRWYHQSVLKNNTLYIHGGIQTFNVPGHQTNWTNNTLGYNPFLLQVDLTTTWDWKTNLSYIALKEEPNPLTGTSVRNGSILGTMFQGPGNDSSVYTYGGTTFRGNESFPNPDANYYHVQYSDQYPLWAFDNHTQIWNQYDIEQSWTPSYGAGAEAPDQGLAFYLSGRTDNGTSSSTLHDGDVQTLLDGMVAIDLVKHTSRNLSTAGMKDDQPRLGGAMQYAGGVGENGVLVAFGGQVFDGKSTTTSQDEGRILGFDSVDVFDIATYLKDPKSNGTWYSQTTSGDIPAPRIDFCTIIASAPDNSSHNIYLYAGRDPTASNGTVFYDDVYVLSLPSFTWINIFSGKSPRWGHTCHLAGKRQMITVGGHNYKNNTCDWEKQGVALLDLPTIGWGSVYRATDDPYELSDNMVAKLGGSRIGGATRKVPEKGWATPGFEEIMRTTRIYSNDGVNIRLIRDLGDSGLDSKTRTATIAGGSVAGVVLIACMSWIIYLYRRSLSTGGRSITSRGSCTVAETEGLPKFELSPDEKKMYEVTGTECQHEFPSTPVKAEADGANAVTYAVELPTTNFQENGRWGVPVIRVPSPSHLKRTESGSSGSSTTADGSSPAMPGRT